MGDLAGRDLSGNTIMNSANARLLDQIKTRVRCVKLCVPVVSGDEQLQQHTLDHVLKFERADITNLPSLGTTLKSQGSYVKTRIILKHFTSSVDLLLIRLPFQLPLCLLGLGKPKLLHVVSNQHEIIKASTDYNGPLKFLARGFAQHSVKIMRRLTTENSTRVITNGQQMWDILGCQRGRVIVSSAMYRREMRPRSQFELGTPPRILFIGYLRPEKGVHILLKAFTRLRQTRDIKLTLVGGTDRATNAEDLIRRQIGENPFREDIELKGSVPFGEALFDLYRGHDVFVLPSLSEGTPRTLVEARALGCPVVSTNAGGIPSSVIDGRDGLLVEPGNVPSMVEAINRILDDQSLRLRLIMEGLARSKDFTIEEVAEQITNELRLLSVEAVG